MFQPGGLHPLQEMPAQTKDIPKKERECDVVFHHHLFFPFYFTHTHTHTHNMSTYLGTMPVLTCQTTNSSSDTNFTELTTGTSIKTHNNGSFIVIDQNDLANGRHSTLTSTENKATEIQGYYESSPPDVAAEMERWFAATDRFVSRFCIDDLT